MAAKKYQTCLAIRPSTANCEPCVRIRDGRLLLNKLAFEQHN